MNAPLRWRAAGSLLAVRATERLQTLRPEMRRRNRAYLRQHPPSLPVPPTRLIAQVAGSPDVRWFLEGGALALESMCDVLATNGRRVEELEAILDFGCGCGRVLRHWPGVSGAALYGTDYNAGLIAWCQAHLPFARVAVNALHPPLAYAAATFDLCYGLSVMTHLPEDLQHAWVDDLTRVLRPGGFLLLTTHGDFYRPHLSPAEGRSYDAGQLVTRHEKVAGTNRCTTFHPPAYIRNALPRGLELLAHLPQGARGNPQQDLILLRKPS
jgi:SAM-dependent methyltransferase